MLVRKDENGLKEDEFEQARHALLTEPNARENIELAYEKRFQERQKKKK